MDEPEAAKVMIMRLPPKFFRYDVVGASVMI
jgi:hypothetical protein